MRKIKLIGMAVALATLTACSKVPAGYQGVIVNLYGSDKGVSDKSVGVGRYWVGWNEELYVFPTFLQNYTWTKQGGDNGDESITMQTSDGLTINADVGITYQIKPDNVVKVFQKYRHGVGEITNVYLRNMVRDAMNKVASTMSVEQLYGSQKDQFIESVNNLVKTEAAQSGIDVDKVYLTGTFRLPESVEQSINAKIQASQNAMRVENEVATSKAEAQKTIIQAQAQATANDLIEKSITPEYTTYLATQKWNGVLPKVTGGAVPMVNIANEADKN